MLICSSGNSVRALAQIRQQLLVLIGGKGGIKLRKLFPGVPVKSTCLSFTISQQLLPMPRPLKCQTHRAIGCLPSFVRCFRNR